MTALGEGPVSAFLAADLAAVGVRVLDATAPAASPAPEAGEHPTDAGERESAPTSSRASREPAVSSIIEHPRGRMVASTNARLDADPERVAAELPERVGAVLIDGHNPALAHAALTLGVPEVDGEDPFAPLEARPPHPRILDGGSWKDWLTPLLGFVDIAVVSEDFAPPLMARPDGAQVAEFLRGFGITRTVRTRGDRSGAVLVGWHERRGSHRSRPGRVHAGRRRRLPRGFRVGNRARRGRGPGASSSVLHRSAPRCPCPLWHEAVAGFPLSRGAGARLVGG